MTFSVGTGLITVVLTTYAYYAISTAVGSSSLGLGTENTFRFMLIHGMLFIFHSGLWMIFASSGIPEMGDHPKIRAFPPYVPPGFLGFLDADPTTVSPFTKWILQQALSACFSEFFSVYLPLWSMDDLCKQRCAGHG
eukprot:CAMPEP_0194347394 /NCGR_PEP_ID=MMETSP0171-20130528/105965_1 /TAXON_ID=218684 /ORGANISM="Corethron pennatum, Strain L29A3" /LENGTH=136 /DNA_ID=CAMNT_0039114641 /DNA_START=81 /DNA_END=492 /DNA_ORIENTATION=+